jgi:hypothetical protein
MDITKSWSAELAAERAIGKESAPDALQVSDALGDVVAPSSCMVCPQLMTVRTMEVEPRQQQPRKM